MEGIEVLDVMDLVKKADARWKEMKAKREEEEKEMKAKLADALKKEGELRKKLDKDRKIVEGMEREYTELERRVLKEQKVEIEQRGAVEKDVKEGLISMSEFYSKGKPEKQRAAMAIEQTLREMEEALNAVRAKNLEILNLELALAKQQQRIFGLSLYPGYALMKALKDQHDFVDRETAILLEDRIRADSSVEIKKSDLILVEKGHSLGLGKAWSNLSLEEAQRLIFNPIIPQQFIGDLKRQLADVEGTDRAITVHYYVKGSPGREESVVVSLSPMPGRSVSTTGTITTKKGGKFVTKKEF